MKEFKKLIMVNMILNLFTNTNTTNDNTTGNDLSPEMKTYYSDYLIDLVEPMLVHDQFGQKKPIPANGGKTIEFRKYDSLPKATTPLTEGVTPNGQKMNVTTVTATVGQYGDYIEMSDVLLLTAIDNNLVEATKLIASQAGRTLDTVTRNALIAPNGGAAVFYPNGKTTTASLVGGASSGNDYISVDLVRNVVRALKKSNTAKLNGYYWGIIHPDIEFDLMSDPAWVYPHQYKDTKNLYENELGEIAGVRFVESTEAKIIKNAAKDNTTASARDVYITLIGGANAYGVTEVTGGGLKHIVKPLGSAGSADPLDQRATVGWKALKVAEVLVEQYMWQVITTSTVNDHEEN